LAAARAQVGVLSTSPTRDLHLAEEPVGDALVVALFRVHQHLFELRGPRDRAQRETAHNRGAISMKSGRAPTTWRSRIMKGGRKPRARGMAKIDLS